MIRRAGSKMVIRRVAAIYFSQQSGLAPLCVAMPPLVCDDGTNARLGPVSIFSLPC
jgi:hypothetical protein